MLCLVEVTVRDAEHYQVLTEKHTAVHAPVLMLGADHYQGLSENWTAGPVYCSAVTGRLAMHLCGVPAHYIHTLPMNKPVLVQGEQPACLERKLDGG